MSGLHDSQEGGKYVEQPSNASQFGRGPERGNIQVI